MKHPRIRTARSLAGMVLVLLGLTAYGCGDSATVTEPASLGGLSASPGLLEPKFNPATTNYTVKLFGSESSTTITASPQVAGDTIRINNIQTTSQTVTIPSIGASELVNIVVTETGAGGTSKSYSVRVSREEEDTTLKDLASSDGTLAPSPFVKTELAPSISGLGNGVKTITLTATKSDPNTVMEIQLPTTPVTVITVPAGTPSGNAIVQLGGPGSDTKVPIVITGPKGGKTTYQVTIKRGASDNAFLGSLALPSGLRLDPRFQSTTTDYTVGVANDVATITVTPTAQDPTARITVNGLATDSGQRSQPIPLNEPGFNASRTNINITVIAQDNVTNRKYTVTVIRAALGGDNNLSTLTVRQSTSSPNLITFSSSTTNYTVDVGSGVSTITVTPTQKDPAATLTVTSNGPGPITISGRTRTIRLRDAGSSTTINILVRAPNGSEKSYTITVDRATPPPPSGNNNLSELTVSPGTLSPSFSATRTKTDYAVNDIDSSATSILVTATPQDSSATVFIDTVRKNPHSITLPTGPSTTEINVLVRAPNQNEKTYSITVTRPAPAAPPAPPATAPDLITADDSCPLKPLSVGNETGTNDDCALDTAGIPFGTRDDNFTAVTKPGFTIPQHNAGETPSLYVGTTKYTFASGTTTLRPPVDLSEEAHTITYTLTNAGGESEPSPPLTVNINKAATQPPSTGP